MGRRSRNQNTILNYVDDVKDGQVRLLQVSGSGGVSFGGIVTTTAVVHSGSIPRISVSNLTDSNAFVSVFDPFQASSHSSYVSGTNFAHNGDPVDITFTSADGRFTVDKAGTYKIEVIAIFDGTGSPALHTININKNGSSIFTTIVGVHSVVDPDENTFTIIEDLAASDYIEFTSTPSISSFAADGTTMNIWRLDHDLVEVVKSVSGSSALAGSGPAGAVTIWSEEASPLLSGTSEFKWDKTEKVLTLSGTMVIESGSGDFIVNGGRIGVGTFAPTDALTIVSGSFSLQRTGGSTGITQGVVGGTSTMEFTTHDGAGTQATRLMLRGGLTEGDVEIYSGGSGAEVRYVQFNAGTSGLSIGPAYALVDPPLSGAIIEGNVGIGTSAPASRLDVDGVITVRPVGSFSTIQSNSTDARMDFISDRTNSNNLSFKFRDVADNPFLCIRDDGRVGVGTNVPQNEFHTVGTVRMSNVLDATGEYLLVLPNSPAGFVRLQTPVSHLEIESGGRIENEIFGTGDYFQVRQGANERLRLTGNGSLDLPNNNRISVTMTGTGLASAALFNIFDSASWSVFSSTNNITAQRMTYSSAAGTFTATDAGTYMIVVTLVIEHASSSTAIVTVRRNGSIIHTVTPFIHSAVDPVERTISMMTDMTAGQFIEVFIDGVGSITMHDGTTFNMWKIG